MKGQRRDSSGGEVPQTRPVEIPMGGFALEGVLTVPGGAPGIVLFAHGSGSSRRSPRNTFVARALERAGLATLLLDLLTEAEATDRAKVFDVDLLAERLGATAAWIRREPQCRALRAGYFGASTGAAAALIAAARDPAVQAVVSRGGRPDLAGALLADVRAPTLLIVGGDDDVVIRLNQDAYARLRYVKQLSIVPGAGHLFGEPGALEEVVRLATAWFLRFLREPAEARP